MFGSICACDPTVKFYRGYESCIALVPPIQLTREEKRAKQIMRQNLLNKIKFTDIDYLLNCGRLQDAAKILLEIQRQLRQVYKKIQT